MITPNLLPPSGRIVGFYLLSGFWGIFYLRLPFSLFLPLYLPLLGFLVLALWPLAESVFCPCRSVHSSSCFRRLYWSPPRNLISSTCGVWIHPGVHGLKCAILVMESSRLCSACAVSNSGLATLAPGIDLARLSRRGLNWALRCGLGCEMWTIWVNCSVCSGLLVWAVGSGCIGVFG